ncbi:MAG: DEAD/DEAH box helicase family protein [Chloroflexota bacterium]|nr:DEAD/DEAH box helicase family protein [Chloroflexota bacterium]
MKDYQANTLEAFAAWLEALTSARLQSEAAINALKQAGPAITISEELYNYPRIAWQQLKDAGRVADTAGEYVSRTDDANRPIPHICFKVPTGGGKTLLAAAALQRLRRQTGLTLWVTPTRAIYEQTKAALRSREHPYRQMLEIASAGRVKLLEKDDLFTKADIENYLCVMLLMLPAANRQRGRDFLRMFRDSGRYPTLFPDSDDLLGDARLLNDYPDLERITDDGPVKHSLFNVFKMLRPVVILDEAHKAYGARKLEANEEFARSVSRLDPSLVIELSATPNRGISNLLVDITGVELKNEEMIKLPVQVTSFTNADWHYTLAQAHDELERLDTEAKSLQMSEGRYIRPIAVVRVERTGRDQRDGERVHSEDVRDYLTQNLGVPENSIAVKSSELDELGRDDLLSEFSPVRWVITRAALMEGWDCPFAYLLVMLDNTRAQRAVTQLVGRVMRQPHARRTGRDWLDQCYVYCWNTSVGDAVAQVKRGLEEEGLTGLGDEVTSDSTDFRRITIQRREGFEGKDIFLPLVLHQHGEGWGELDYQAHILPEIDWDAIESPDPKSSFPDRAVRQSASVDVGDALPIFHPETKLNIPKEVQINWFARRLSDVVPNSWQAARIARQFVMKLRDDGDPEDEIYDRRSYLAFALRDHVANQLQLQAEKAFRGKLRDGQIRFDLEAGQPNFRMVESYEIPVASDAALLAGNGGRQVQLSLFEPVYAQQFDSTLERDFARYLDEQKALKWWHRVAVRQRGDYYLRGWKQERIWPDFVAMGGETKGKPHVLVFETKGEHLRGNPDTDYKQRVLETLQNAFNCGTMTIKDGPTKGTFRLVFNEAEFPEALATLQAAYDA